jgi:hypothetical protein
MNAPDMLVPTIFFWILAVLSVSLAPRYAILAYVLLVQFDLTGVAFYADSSFGWLNAIKIVAIPTVLLLRVAPVDLLPSAFSGLRNLWVFLVGYAALSVTWSPFHLSAIKMMGYFYAYSILFLIFTHAWRRQWFSNGSFVLVTLLSLLLAAIQTYLLGNPYGDVEHQGRFTSFTDAQSFAPFLVCMIILLILCGQRTVLSWMTAAVAVVGLLLTGSRSYFVGFAWVALILGLALGSRFRQHLGIYLIFKSAIVGVLTVALLAVIVYRNLPQSRLNELVDVAASDNTSLQEVGTFAWRVQIWEKTVEALAGRDFRGLILGSGTSSGAAVAMQTDFFEEVNVDPNRCIHDEFLRTAYEWGAIGLLAFVCFLGALFKLSFTMARITQFPEAWACLAVTGPLVIGLLIENIFADAASPGGVGFCLVFASMVAQLRPAMADVEVMDQALIPPERATG